MEEQISGPWEEAVKHILELGKTETEDKAAMRHLGQMAGSYYLGLLDSGVSSETIHMPFFWTLMGVMRAKKDGVI